jgi:hypothetical protein
MERKERQRKRERCRGSRQTVNKKCIDSANRKERKREE